MKPWLPDGCKSGLRLGLGLFALALVDFLVQGPDAAQGGGEGSTAYNYIHQGALWAAVTLIVVSAPEFVGATAWLCIQRLLGNIMGGEPSPHVVPHIPRHRAVQVQDNHTTGSRGYPALL